MELEAILIDRALACELLGERRRSRNHAGDNLGLRRKVALVERAPGIGVGAGEFRHAAGGLLHVASNSEDASVGKHLPPVRVWRDQLKPVTRKSKLLRRGSELGDEIAARMDVGEEAWSRQFLRDRHAPIGLVALEHQNLEAGASEIAGACQSVMPRADDDSFAGAPHPALLRT